MNYPEIRELKIRKKDFQIILKAVVQWERENLSEESVGYKIRKLLTEVSPQNLIITMLKLEEAVYYVVVRFYSGEGEISTSWIHEDDIYRERLFYANDKNHLSHKIVCLTDLYEISEIVKSENSKKIA